MKGFLEDVIGDFAGKETIFLEMCPVFQENDLQFNTDNQLVHGLFVFKANSSLEVYRKGSKVSVHSFEFLHGWPHTIARPFE